MKRIIFFFLFLHFASGVYATHIRGGQITIKIISGNTCQVTLRGFAKTISTVKWEGGTLDFGDGSSPIIVPSENYTSILDPLVGIYLFNINHTYPGPGFYTVSYFDRNLNAGILNMDNSVDTPFSISSRFVLDPLLKISPAEFPTDPIFRAFTGQSYSFSTAPIDTSYVYGYELITPDAINYVVPESFKINSQTGLITWDTKFKGTYLAGEYFFAIKVNQYDKAKRYLGYVVRSFSLLLEDSMVKMSISNPIADPIGKIIVTAPNQIKVKLLLSDSTNADSLRWFPYYHQSLANNISFVQYDSADANSKIRVGVLSFTSTDAITRELPYTIVLRGVSSFKYAAKDVSYLLFTKDAELPVITEIGRKDGDVLIFPNPCSNELHVVGIPNSGKVQVFNNLGQPILTSFIDSENKIDTTQLSPGVYFVVISNENSNTHFKVIKK